MIPIHTPITLACEWYEAYAADGARFSDLLQWFLAHGTVYSDANTFIMARPWHPSVGAFDPVRTPDTWLIYLAASNGVTPLRRFMELAPFPLPCVAFHRRGVMRGYTWQRLAKKLQSKSYGNHLQGA